MVNFETTMLAYLPLATPKKLMNPNFPIPISIIYGDSDFMSRIEGKIGNEIVELNS